MVHERCDHNTRNDPFVHHISPRLDDVKVNLCRLRRQVSIGCRIEQQLLVTNRSDRDLPRLEVDDVQLVLHVQHEVHIIDYKTGKIPVRAQGNSQLMYYALCHAWRAPKAKSVHLHIVQPWSPDGSSHYEVSAKELAEYMELCQETEQKILAKDTTLTPSDNCLFCPAYPHSRGDKGRPFCPPALQLLYPPVVDEDAILALLDE